MWFLTQDFPGSAPFSGGLLDAWPAYMVDGLRICRAEMQRIDAFLKKGTPPRG